MKLEDIHPDDFVRQVAALLDGDMAHLLERRADFVEAPCPCCGDQGFAPAFEHHGLTYRRCRDCGLVYLGPRPTPAVLRDFFAGSKGLAFIRENMPQALAAKRRETLYARRVDKILEILEHLAGDRPRLLEIGAGDGTLGRMLLLTGRFEEIWLLDPVAPKMDADGIRIIRDTIEAAHLPPCHGDFIIAFEVLEHLLEPRVFAAKSFEFLRPGGNLLVTTPNFSGYEIEVLGSASTSVGWDHFNYFSIPSLTRLMEAAGFAVREISTPGELDLQMIYKRRQEGDFDSTGNPALDYLLTDGWDDNAERFQQYLVGRRRSSHMLCWAQKPPVPSEPPRS